MSHTTLTSPFLALVPARLAHRSRVPRSSTRNSDVHLPTQGGLGFDAALTMAQARTFLAMR